MNRLKTLALFLLFFLFALFPAFGQEEPVSALGVYQRARSFEVQGRRQDAINNYNEAIRLSMAEIDANPQNMDAYTAITGALRRVNRYQEAVDWGLRALAVNGQEYRVIENMGESYFYLNNYPRCLQFMQTYVNALPRGERASVAYFFIGEIYRVQRKYRHADIAYTTALHVEPNANYIWYFRLGQVKEYLGEKNGAASAYEQALRLNPQDSQSAEGLARTRG
jgi:tetratricopeptide (TPR) repeat protein